MIKGISMKKRIITTMIVLFTLQIVHAQGTIYVSNLGQSPSGSYEVGSDSWYAAYFSTGPNAGGYMLGSVQLAMADGAGSPDGFTVMIYNNGADGLGAVPGSSLATLNGSANPSAAGTYTYTADSSLVLSPNTDYFIVLTAGTAVANGAYEWSEGGNYSQEGYWLTASPAYSSDGSDWVGCQAFLNMPSQPRPFLSHLL
jgi:hypothetical protein